MLPSLFGISAPGCSATCLEPRPGKGQKHLHRCLLGDGRDEVGENEGNVIVRAAEETVGRHPGDWQNVLERRISRKSRKGRDDLLVQPEQKLLAFFAYRYEVDILECLKPA